MRKTLLGLLLVGGSFVFYDDASASEVSDNSDEQLQPVEQEEVETIYFGEDQDVLITDDVIIRKISDSPQIGNELSLMGAGQWDKLGQEYVGKTSGVYPSHGGDYQVIVSQSKGGPYYYTLREHDGGTSSEAVKNFHFPGIGAFEMTFRDISSWCDGDDGLAEFYIYKSTMTSTADLISFWD